MKTKKLIFSVLFFTFAIGLLSAQEKRNVRQFDKISAGRAIQVYFTQSNSYSLEIEGDVDEIKKVTTQVENKVLKISLEKNYNPKGKLDIKVYVSAPELKEINLSSATTFKCEKLERKGSFKIDLNSAAKVEINNLIVAKKIEINASSAANCFISNLKANSCNLNASSTAKINIDIANSEKVKAEASSQAIVKMSGEIRNVTASASSGSNIDIRHLKYNNSEIKKSSGANIHQ